MLHTLHANDKLDHPKNDEIIHIQDIVSKLNFSNINYKLMLENPEKWDVETITAAEKDYRNFLVLHALHRNVDLVPTELIDEYWHQHILDTRKYAEDCQILFGEFLHHDPYFGVYGDADKQQNLAAFKHTEYLWLNTFGEKLLGNANPCKSTDCR